MSITANATAANSSANGKHNNSDNNNGANTSEKNGVVSSTNKTTSSSSATTSSSSSNGTLLLTKLITTEDPYHIHKTLGIAGLISYAIRFANFRVASDCYFEDHPEWTIPTCALHLSLNLSSFVFTIPPRRINSGYRIWPEFRWHTFIFTCHVWFIMLLFWYEKQYHKPRQHWINYFITILNMAGCDLASWYVGPQYHSKTIRDVDILPSVKFLFSWAQHFGKAITLYSPARRCSNFYFYSMVLQINSFMMTLRRKNIASHNLLITIYGVLLVYGSWLGFVAQVQFGSGYLGVHVLATMANTGYFLRVGPTLCRGLEFLHNKYILWTILGSILNFWFLPLYDSHPGNPQEDLLTDSIKYSSTIYNITILGVLYYYKVYYEEQQRKGSSSSITTSTTNTTTNGNGGAGKSETEEMISTKKMD